MIRFFFTSLLLLCLCVPVQADDLPHFLVGDWKGQGDGVWGAFDHRLEVRPVLNGRALEFVMRHKREIGIYHIRGMVIKDVHGNLRAYWYDEDGVVAHYDVKVEKNSLTVRTEYGRNRVNVRVWKLGPDDTVSYRFLEGEKGELKPFNQALLNRN
jgi:hypothetical protein